MRALVSNFNDRMIIILFDSGLGPVESIVKIQKYHHFASFPSFWLGSRTQYIWWRKYLHSSSFFLASVRLLSIFSYSPKRCSDAGLLTGCKSISSSSSTSLRALLDPTLCSDFLGEAQADFFLPSQIPGGVRWNPIFLS